MSISSNVPQLEGKSVNRIHVDSTEVVIDFTDGSEARFLASGDGMGAHYLEQTLSVKAAKASAIDCYDMLHELRRIPRISKFILAVNREWKRDVIKLSFVYDVTHPFEYTVNVDYPNEIDPSVQIKQLDTVIREAINHIATAEESTPR